MLRTLSRRVITVPLMMVAAGVAWSLSPLILTGVAATDLIFRTRSFAHTRAVLFFMHYLLCETVGILAATILWILTLGGTIGGQRRFLALNAGLQRLWSGTLFWGAVRIFSMKIKLENATRPIPSPMILLVRHASTADTVLAAAFVANPHRIVLRYVMKAELLWDPCLDIVGQRLPNIFIDRTASDKKGQIMALQALAEDLTADSGLLIFPEGTRYSKSGYEKAMQRLRAQPEQELALIAARYQHVMPPRTAGTLALLDAAPNIPVVVLAHTGFEGARSFHEFWSGALIGQTITSVLWTILPDEIPASGRELWLYQLWSRLDQWIGAVQGSAQTNGEREKI